MPEPITIYGEPTCEDTEAVRARLRALGIPFAEVNIDEHADASAFVIVANRGFRSTPTIVVGEGKRKLLLTEPTEAELDDALRWAGHLSAGG